MSSDKRLHVVFWRWYSASAGWGGSEARLLSYLRELDPLRARATILTNIDLFSDRLEKLALPVHVELFSGNGYEGRLQRSVTIVRVLRRLHPDRLVVLQGGFRDFLLSDLLCAAIASFPRVRRPTEFHLSSPDQPPASESEKKRIALRGSIAAQVVAVSEGARARMVEWYGYSRTRTRVIHHGVDPQRFDLEPEFQQACRSTVRMRFGIPEDATVVVSCSRFSPEKHLDWIADASVELGARRPEVHWLFVGDGPLLEPIRSRLATSDVRERVHFAGFVPDVRDYLFASDIFVLASDVEGLSNSMLEAMAAGLVTVCTKAPGAEDAIVHSRTGWLCEISAEDVLRQLAQSLEMTPSARAAMRESARESIRTRFDVRVGICRALSAIGIPRRSPTAAG